jgi:hypothetical protein
MIPLLDVEINLESLQPRAVEVLVGSALKRLRSLFYQYAPHVPASAMSCTYTRAQSAQHLAGA